MTGHIFNIFEVQKKDVQIKNLWVESTFDVGSLNEYV